MTISDKKPDLDQLFAEARQARPDLPDDLAVRILTDAEAVRLERQKQAVPARRNPILGLFDGLGGWQGLSGLVAASLAGLWVGFSAPSFLPDPADFIVTQDSSYLIADLGLEAIILEDYE